MALAVPNEFGALCGAPHAYCSILLPLCPETRRTLLAVREDPELIFGRAGKMHYGKFERERLPESLAKALAPFERERSEE